ncbi:MAG: efflux RND transporter periplasmic adaptor subunit [Chloroflexota bacterium]
MKIVKYISVFSLAIALITSCSKKVAEEAKGDEEKQSNIIQLTGKSVREIQLEISEAEEGELTGAIEAPAKIIPNQDMEAFAGSLIEGRASKVYVNIGDHVEKGQTLMLIEGLQIGVIKSEFIKAKANLNYAEANYKRQKTLSEQNVGSQKSLLEAKADFDRAVAEFNAEDRKIHSIGLSDKDVEESNGKEEHKAGFLSVKAPISGTIVERNVVIGQLVEPNSNSFRIINTGSLMADAQIYESDLIRIGGKTDIELYPTAFPDIPYKGRITYISDVVDNETRTIKIRAAIRNDDRRLKPEMFAKMLIPTAKSGSGLIVTSDAVIKDGSESYVFVALNDTTFEKRNVLLGGSQGEKVQIRAGLRRGERLVSKGSFMLKSELKKSMLESED